MSHFHHQVSNTFEEYCQHKYIYKGPGVDVPQADRCDVIGGEYCGEAEGFINFYQMYYCLINEKPWLLILMAVLIVFFNFRYMAIVVEEYCAEGITMMSEWLGFSQSLAGVTLLAFANGAGDVITAVVASGSSEGVFYNIGSIYGAGLFVCCCVVAVAIFKSDEGGIQFDEMIIKRDISIYIITTIVVIFLGIYGQITWISSFILLFIYTCQVLIVLWQDRQKKDGENALESMNYELENQGIDYQRTRAQNYFDGNDQSINIDDSQDSRFRNPLAKDGGQVLALAGNKVLLKQYTKSKIDFDALDRVQN
jgi:Ca2+/Na+ antiporter